MQWLLINRTWEGKLLPGRDQFGQKRVDLPYIDKFQLFNDKEKLVKEAKKLGWEDSYGFGITDNPGVMSVYSADVKLEILCLESK